MTVVLGYTGQINLAQATFFGLGAYAVGLGTVVLGLNFWVTLLLGIRPRDARRLRAGPHDSCGWAATISRWITISFQQIFDLVLVNWSGVTQGPDGVAGIGRPSIFGFLFADDRFYLVLCLVFLYAAIAFVWWLPQTRTGRAMRAVRGKRTGGRGDRRRHVARQGRRVHAERGACRRRRRVSTRRASRTSAPTTSTSRVQSNF